MIRVKADRKNMKSTITIDDAPRRVRRGIRNALTEIGKENVRFAKDLIKKPPKSGRVYFIKGKRHRASAPGEPPANLSGKLMRSVHSRTYGWHKMEFGDAAPHGKFLELGTRKMQPRPHLTRTVRAKRRDNFNVLEAAVDMEVKRS
jgi:hypothetical protein